MRCRMEQIEQIQNESSKLLSEIGNLKKNLNEIYTQKGPANSDYISLSIKLKVLMKEYFEGQITKTQM